MSFRFVKQNRSPYHSSKPQILDDISKNAGTPDPTHSEGVAVDLSVIIQAQAAVLPERSTCNAFISRVLQNIASTATHLGASRIYIVADQYNQLSIKSPNRLNKS